MTTLEKSEIRRRLELISTFADYGDCCNCCGYPFDRDERLYATKYGEGERYCSVTCAAKVELAE